MKFLIKNNTRGLTEQSVRIRRRLALFPTIIDMPDGRLVLWLHRYYIMENFSWYRKSWRRVGPKLLTKEEVDNWLADDIAAGDFILID